MGFVIKLSLYLLFVLIIALQVFLGLMILGREMKDLRKGVSLLGTELLALLGTASFFGLVWSLSRSFSLSMAIAFLVVMHAGVVTGFVLKVWFSGPDVAWGSRMIVGITEFQRRSGAWYKRLQSTGGVVYLFGLLIVGGIILFGQRVPSDNATLWAFRLVVFGALMWTPIQLIPAAGVMLSRHIDEGTRSRMFSSKVAELVSITFYVSLALWAFSIPGTGWEVELGNGTLDLSPGLFVVLTVLAAVFVVPYLIGVRRAEAWRVQLLEERIGLQDAFTEVLNGDSATVPDEARALADEVADRESAFVAQFPFVGELVGLGRAAPLFRRDPEAEMLYQAFTDSRDLDPRFSQIDFFDEIESQIREAADAVDSAADAATAIALATQRASTLHAAKADLKHDIQEEKANRPRLAALVKVGLTALAAQAVGFAAPWVTSFLPSAQ